MIQPLRTVHRNVFVILALAIPLILTAGLGARHSRQGATVPAAQVPASMHLVRETSRAWLRHAMEMKYYTDSAHPGSIYVVFHAAEELNEPDLLVYGSAILPSGDTLPSDARFVGRFAADQPLALPANSDLQGYLVLFSLPHQSVFDTAKLENLP